jgi:SAM-dependent methyltransferase
MIKAYFKKQTFNPDILGVFINPFYFARRSLYANVKRLAPHISGNILDVGCGQKPYKHLFQYRQYIGIEVAQEGHDHTNEDIDLYYDGRNIPFDAGRFDAAITSQVLEHVFTPHEFLQEIHRVLKPEGKLLLTVPFVWDEHEQPFDYARYSSFGLKDLLEKNGFTIVEHIKSAQDVRVIFQLVNVYIFKKTIALRRNPMGHIIASFFLNAWVNILGLIFYALLPKNADLYLDNVVVAKRE